MAFSLAGLGYRFRLPFGRLQGPDLLEELRIIRGDLGLQRVEQAERGRQVEEEMFVGPSCP
jgi:hypothetical protein